jgi:hypothetical protein
MTSKQQEMPSALKSEHKALQCGYGSAIPVIEKQQAFLQGCQPLSKSVRKSMVPYVIRKPLKSTKATSPIAIGPLLDSLCSCYSAVSGTYADSDGGEAAECD